VLHQTVQDPVLFFAGGIRGLSLQFDGNFNNDCMTDLPDIAFMAEEKRCAVHILPFGLAAVRLRSIRQAQYRSERALRGD
jgi:hypothetical protein